MDVEAILLFNSTTSFLKDCNCNINCIVDRMVLFQQTVRLVTEPHWPYICYGSTGTSEGANN